MITSIACFGYLPYIFTTALSAACPEFQRVLPYVIIRNYPTAAKNPDNFGEGV
jgi:hypothetical protein